MPIEWPEKEPKPEAGRNPMPEERMLKWFDYGHLPDHLRDVSRPFCELATIVIARVDPGPERTFCLRSLLLAKDAAVRAKLHPGG